MSHTPGPWFDDGYRIYAPTPSADKRFGRMIVEYKHVDGFNYADAALIVAAPDLLAAAKATLAMLDQSAPGIGHYRLREAIAKAESGSISSLEEKKST